MTIQVENQPRPANPFPVAVKIVVTGGPRVGKSTAVAALSEIEPLAPTGGDGAVLDLGRVSISPELVLYTFGTASIDGLEDLLDDVSSGAIGGLVLVDSTRLGDARNALACFARSGLPFVLAINDFDDHPPHQTLSSAQVRAALEVPAAVPVLHVDPRQKTEVKAAVVALLNQIMSGLRG